MLAALSCGETSVFKLQGSIRVIWRPGASSSPLTVLLSPRFGVLGVYSSPEILAGVIRDLDRKGLPYKLHMAPGIDPSPPLAVSRPGCIECRVGWAIYNADPSSDPPVLGVVQGCDLCSLPDGDAALAARKVGFLLDSEGNVLSAAHVEAPHHCYACGGLIHQGSRCPTCAFVYGKPRRDRVMLGELGPFACEPLDRYDTWNGFQKPLFTRAEGEEVCRALRSETHIRSAGYDAERDAFVISNEEDGEDGPEIFEALNGLYPIGAGCWVWTLDDEHE